MSALAERHQLGIGLDLQRSEALRRRVNDVAHRLSKERAALLAQLVSGGMIKPRHLVLQLSETRLSSALDIQPAELDQQALCIEAPFALRRRGVEGKVVLGDRSQGPDLTLLRALAHAHAWIADLRAGTPLSEIAAQTGHSDSYIRTRAQLAFLSPTIQQAILAGRQPPDLTLQKIVRKPVPLSWQAQARLYGFDPARS